MKYIYIITLIFTTSFIACNDQDSKENLHYVQIDSAALVENINTQLINFYNIDSPYAPPIVPVYNGDYILFGNTGLYKYEGNKDLYLQYAYTDSIDHINGKINSIEINSKGLKYLDQSRLINSSIEGLKNITIELDKYDTLPEKLLTTISKYKNNVGITFLYDSADHKTISNFKWLLNQFKPIYIKTIFTDSIVESLKLAEKTEFLFLQIDSPITNKSLPNLSNLKQLIIYNRDAEITSLPETFLVNNDQIEQITFSAHINKDLKILNPLKNLTSLHLMLDSNFQDLHELHRFKNLKRIIIEGGYVNNLEEIKNLKKLAWLRLPDSIDKIDLQNILNTHPTLEVLELSYKSNIKDFSFLKANKRLKALTVYSDKKMDIYGLDQLQHLEFLSLPKTKLNDSLLFNHLKKSLPNTKLVPNSGICLSSIWLLLIFPFIITIYFFKKRYFEN